MLGRQVIIASHSCQDSVIFPVIFSPLRFLLGLWFSHNARGLSSDFIPEGCLVLSFLVCLVIYEKLFGPSKQKVVQPESLRKEIDQFRPNKFVMNTGCASSLTSLGPLNLKLWGRTRNTWRLVVASNCGVTNAAPLQPHLHIPKLTQSPACPAAKCLLHPHHCYYHSTSSFIVTHHASSSEGVWQRLRGTRANQIGWQLRFRGHRGCISIRSLHASCPSCPRR